MASPTGLKFVVIGLLDIRDSMSLFSSGPCLDRLSSMYDIVSLRNVAESSKSSVSDEYSRGSTSTTRQHIELRIIAIIIKIRTIIPYEKLKILLASYMGPWRRMDESEKLLTQIERYVVMHNASKEA